MWVDKEEKFQRELAVVTDKKTKIRNVANNKL